MYDCHMHCYHSHDNNTPIEDMIDTAIARGCKYIAFSDHLDRDFLYDDSSLVGESQLDLDWHIREVLAMKEKYAGKIDIALGVECGFSLSSASDYNAMLANKPMDVILCSVHTVAGVDCYELEYFAGHSKADAYSKYLRAIYDSVTSDVDYDIVTHIGYVCRKAPYECTKMEYSDFHDIIDDILRGMIARGLTLELNSHSRGTGADFLPYPEIVDRYIELGGEDFSFGTDAHRVDRVAEKYQVARDFLLAKNVKYINTFMKRQKIKNLL